MRPGAPLTHDGSPFGTSSDRDAAALALTAAERRDVVAGFFAASPAVRDLGRAVLDFVDWQIRSGRIAEHGGGSAWWRFVNGHLVLDLRDATASYARPIDPRGTHGDSNGGEDRTDRDADERAARWVRFATCDGSDPARAQALLWDAHQVSLHAALERAEPLLAAEPPGERWFARTAVAMVDRAAATGQATGTDALDRMTRRHYPDHYPATAADRGALESAIAAGPAGAG